MMNYWDNVNRIDPGQTGGSQPAFNQMWPQDTQENIWSSAYKDLEPSDAMNMWKFAGGMPTDYEIPNFTNIDRGQRVTGWGADPQEKRAIAQQMADAMTGALTNDTGMVRMGGKEFPNAYLHRAIGDPKELDWWSSLFQKGMSSQKPTSAVTPSVLQTFNSEPYGLMFNVTEPNQLKHAAAVDVWSDAENALGSKSSETARKAYDFLQRQIEGLYDAGFSNHLYRKAARTLEDKFGKREVWTPTRGQEAWFDPKKQGLDDLLAEQLRGLQRSGNPSSLHLQHSELIPEIDRSMLAGVRLPLEEPAGHWGKLKPGSDDFNLVFGSQPTEGQLYQALTNFAEQQNVPIFRFPAVETRAQQIKGLENPFAGKWGHKPGSRDYITSSMLPKIFGITELP